MKLIEVLIAQLILGFAYNLYHETATQWYQHEHQLVTVLVQRDQLSDEG